MEVRLPITFMEGVYKLMVNNRSFNFPPESASITLLLRMLAKSIQMLNEGKTPEWVMQHLWSHFTQDYFNDQLGS
jgi:hypothetical protein